jgi:hypothetical protein
MIGQTEFDEKSYYILTNDRPVLSLERAPHMSKPANV